MSQRSKNLLEAFNKSKAPEKSAEPAAQPAGGAPKVGGPFADSAPAPRAPAPAPAPAPAAAPRPAIAAALVGPQQRWRVVALCAAVALIFFMVGRASVGAVEAGGGTGAAALPPGTPPSAPNPASKVAPAKALRDALRDRANSSTILACTYDLTADGQKSADAARASLLQQGLEAEVYQSPAKKQVYLLAGAAPRHSDLDGLLIQVKAAVSQRGKQDFTSARTIQIDSVIAPSDRR